MKRLTQSEFIKGDLDDYNIRYIRQYGFGSCGFVNKLSFDFYLPDYSTCIEFDWIKHFKPIKEFGGNEEFNIIKKRDETKNKWCVKNKIYLKRIKYTNINKIGEILENELTLLDKK